MPIPLRTLRAAATSPSTRVAKSLNEARARSLRTAFLCHSSKDNAHAKGLVTLLQRANWDVYVDYEDTALPEKPDRTTADRIQEKIRSTDFFLFLATANSVISRWCPWEIGFADGAKPRTSIWIVSTEEDGHVYGNEYLDLYRRVDPSVDGDLILVEPRQTQGRRLRGE
ncbi:toll/interleukin-1 receptor domain-containing protein [Bradyrhizobium sp. Bra78]|uniref:toll/interleukin-1 receptor domain-containing protein n=1 Tax=Bradyrhizobium sp. Bra78 TaxID=2926010 RepID=UPI003966E7F2